MNRPPYTRTLQKMPSGLLRIFAGSLAWEAKKPEALECKNFLLAPPRERAAEFSWPVENQMCVIAVRGEFIHWERAELAGALLRDGAIACLFLDSGEWCGKLPADSLYWQEKPGSLQAGRV